MYKHFSQGHLVLNPSSENDLYLQLQSASYMTMVSQVHIVKVPIVCQSYFMHTCYSTVVNTGKCVFLKVSTYKIRLCVKPSKDNHMLDT